MKKLVTKLVKYESDKNHPEEIKKCFDFVVNELKKAGLKIKIFNHNSHLSLIAAHKIKKHYHYILNGHLDVVPASYKDAYKPIIKGNRLYGRGASDMKGPDAALIETTKIPLLKKVDFALILNTDEEIGGTDGVRYLLEDKGYSCDCVIIPDGGDNFQLTLGEKGVLHIQINARGLSLIHI